MILKLIAGVLVALVVSSGTVFGEDVELAAIKKAIKDKGASWTAGENAVTKLSPQARKGLCGAIIVPQTEPGITVKPTKVLPNRWNWRNVNGTDWTTPIRDQGRCGSCVAFGAIGALEPLVRIDENNPTLAVDLSEQHLFSCGGGLCNYGWYPSAAANYLKNYGTPDEACYPYKSWNGVDYPCADTCPDWEDRAVKISQWNWVNNNVENIKAALLKTPLSTTMAVYTDFIYYNEGIYEHTWGSLEGYHQVAFVGYDMGNETTPGHWICKNSWGTGWGEDGWFRIKFGEVEIGNNTILMSGANPPPPPPVLAIDIILNGATFTVGDKLIAKVHVTNDDTPDKVDAKIWIEIPTGKLKSILNMPMVTIGANADIVKQLLDYTVTKNTPLGEYKFGGRFLNWITGDILCEDIEPFVVK
ncbi:MAG: C1 family peptidase [bacterium]